MWIIRATRRNSPMEYGFHPTAVRSVDLFRGKTDVTLCPHPEGGPLDR
jgi:hypothetical protein